MRPIHRMLVLGTLASALLAAPAANACQLVCMKTNTVYSGNLGGLSGADAKCAAEFPGFKFARSTTILANLPNGGTSTNGGNLKIYGASSSGVQDITSAVNAGVYGASTTGVAVGSSTSTATTLGNAWTHGAAGSNCVNWVTGVLGAVGMVSQPTPTPTITVNCDQQLPLLCCNM